MNDQIFYGILMLSLRCIAGFLFFFQAYDKLFRIGTNNVVQQFQPSMPSVPGSVLYIGILLSGITELAGGVLLLAGLWTPYAVVLLLLNLTAVAISFSVIRPMWDMQYYFPRLAIIVAIALLPAEWDVYSLGSLLIK